MNKNSMANAALILGILSIFPGMFSGIGWLTGSIGITLALLSREDEMDGITISALISSIIGSILSLFVLIITILFMLNFDGFREILENPEYYSENMDEFYEKLDEIYDNGGNTL